MITGSSLPRGRGETLRGMVERWRGAPPSATTNQESRVTQNVRRFRGMTCHMSAHRSRGPRGKGEGKRHPCNGAYAAAPTPIETTAPRCILRSSHTTLDAGSDTHPAVGRPVPTCTKNADPAPTRTSGGAL